MAAFLYARRFDGYINSTTATIDSPSPLTSNTWGWYPNSLVNNPGYDNSNPADSDYQLIAIPNSSDPYIIKQTNTATSDSGDLNTITIATKVDTTLPAGTYTNTLTISAVTNYVPQPILDVYPTTGWAGDTITLYSNGGFVNVQSVQIGDTNCTSIDVKSADELTCVLPSKAETDTTSGTDNGYSISVTASNTSLDTHNFTIRYFNPSRTETASVSNTQITNTNMSSFTGVDCGSLSVGDIVSLTDERNGQTYRIKKMQDEKCWMVDNLKYAGEANTDLANVDGTYGLVYNNDSSKYNTVDGTDTQSTDNSDKALYNNPMSRSYCYGTSIQSSYTKCGYLYNWYAATAGTGTYATSTRGTNVSGSICPTGWRLPSASSDGSTATGDGTSYTAADFAVLNASMNAGSLTTGSTSTSYYAGWQYSGAWSGVFSGLWANGFSYQGSEGYYWSSTANSSTNARYLTFSSSSVYPSSLSDRKYVGFAVRCVMDGEAPGVQITYDANGGYFDNDPTRTTNLVSYGVEELSTETVDRETNYYDETFTIAGATSLFVNYSFTTGKIGSLYLSDGSGKRYVIVDGESVSGTVNIPGDTVNIYIWDDTIQQSATIYATITGYSITTNSHTEELTPTRSGYQFLGWYTDSDGMAGNEFEINGNMESGTTVYAKWQELTMQTFTNELCQDFASDTNYTVKDARDGNDYTVRYINGNCWMTQNLRIAGGTTLTSTYSNVSSSYTIPTTDLTSGNSYTDGRIHNSGNSTYGYWYNFCAASAGTNCQDSTKYDTTYDICPKGWRLPTRSEFSGITGTSYISAFSPITGGYYIGGSLSNISTGFWWSATAFASNNQYNLRYNGNSLYTSISGSGNDFGFYVRCIRSS